MGWKKYFLRALALMCVLALWPASAGATETPQPVPSGGGLVENTLGTEVPIQGSMMSKNEILTVVLPVDIPFVVELDENGGFVRLLAASGAAVTNQSTALGVSLTVGGVTDEKGYLDALNLTLTGEKAVPLTASMTDTPLGTVAAGSSMPLKLSGTAGPGWTTGSDGETFSVSFILKVSKAT